jgi:hypothetical protein
MTTAMTTAAAPRTSGGGSRRCRQVARDGDGLYPSDVAEDNTCF